MILRILHPVISILTVIGINIFLIHTAHANYQRCWIENGRTTPNCNPADGYFFKQDNTSSTYQKCPVISGKLIKQCFSKENGYGLFYQEHLWYQCPIQQGEKSESCTLANGYQIIQTPDP